MGYEIPEDHHQSAPGNPAEPPFEELLKRGSVRLDAAYPLPGWVGELQAKRLVRLVQDHASQAPIVILTAKGSRQIQGRRMSPRVADADYYAAITQLCVRIHNANCEAGWWPADKDDRNVGEILCLIHSEISEAMEGHRKDLMDDHLPHREMMEVELADACIRIFDLAAARGYDLGGAIAEKLKYNRHRADHKIENRAKPGGKKY